MLKSRIKFKAIFCLVIVTGLFFSTTSFAKTNEEVMPTLMEITEEQVLEKLNSTRSEEEKLTSIPTEPTIVPVEKEMGPLEKYYPSNMSEEEIEIVIDRIANGENVIFGDGAVDISAIPKERWGSANKTHQWIAGRAFIVLGNEFPDIKSLFKSTEISTVMEYADWPDNNETTRNNSWHFYNYPSGTNYYHESSPTAKDRFIYWYEEAVRKYRSNNVTGAFQDLGKAIHYLSDIGTPVHVGDQALWNAITKKYDLLNPTAGLEHGRYELQAGQIKENYAVYSGGYYEWFCSNELDVISRTNASISYNYYRVGTNGRFEYPLKNIQRDVAGLLYRFYVQTSMLSYH